MEIERKSQNNKVKNRRANNRQTNLPKEVSSAKTPRRFRGVRKTLRNVMSRDGSDWVVAALDPFHDSKRTIAGYPDMDGSSSVVSCVNASVNVAAPWAGPWDCHVFTTPSLTQVATYNQAYANDLYNDCVQSAPTTAFTMGAVNVICGHAGAVLFPDAAGWAPADVSMQTWSPSWAQLGSLSRVVGWGIEIVNTSAVVYKSGSLTAYRMPQRATINDTRIVDATAGNLLKGDITVRRFRAPPKQASEAVVLPNSMTWEAEHGAYIPVTLSGVENPATGIQYEGVEYSYVSDLTGGAKYALGSKAYGAAAETVPYVAGKKFVPYDTVGAHLNGLDQNSTLTIKIKIYIEKFPSNTDLVLLPLASPSAQYDIKALQIYSELVNRLPIATISANNANGDWFKEMWKVLYGIVSGAVGDIPLVGGLVNAAYGAGNGILNAVGSAIPMLP